MLKSKSGRPLTIRTSNVDKATRKKLTKSGSEIKIYAQGVNISIRSVSRLIEDDLHTGKCYELFYLIRRTIKSMLE